MKRRYEIAGIIIFTITTFIFALKILISSSISMADEMHYIATALRFYKGDVFLVDDWSSEQLNGFVLLPFIALFKLVFNSNDGIVIYFRIVYLIFKLICSIYAIHRLNKIEKLTKYSAMGVLCYYFFSPYNIDTMSYNIIPLSMLFLIIIIMITDRRNKWDYYLCGILLAIAVLSQPFLVILYLVGLIAVVNYNWFNRNNHNESVQVLLLKNYCFMTLGAGTLAIIFLLVVLTRASIGDILNNIGYIFSEPDHNVAYSNIFVIMWGKIYNIVKEFFAFCNYKITYINILGVLIIFVEKMIRKLRFSILGTLACLALSCYVILTESEMVMNSIYIPFVWFCVEIYCIMFKNKNRVCYFTALVICFIYTVCVAIGTNTGMYTTSASMCLFAVVSFLIFGEIDSIVVVRRYMTKNIEYSVLALVLVMFLSLRLFIVWRNIISADDYARYIDVGPLKGTYVSEEIFERYNTIISDLNMVNFTDDDILFCGTSTPMSYLYADVEYGTMGTPFFWLDYDRLREYYTLHPNKIPTVIYYEELSNSNEEIDFINFISNNYTIIYTENGLLAVK